MVEPARITGSADNDLPVAAPPPGDAYVQGGAHYPRLWRRMHAPTFCQDAHARAKASATNSCAVSGSPTLTRTVKRHSFLNLS